MADRELIAEEMRDYLKLARKCAALAAENASKVENIEARKRLLLSVAVLDDAIEICEGVIL